MWREMSLLSKKKPLVISMSDVAASGGYYMAMTGDPIVAYPQTETGSIGVVFGKPNLHGLYDKLGITKDAVERGRHAGIDSDYTPLDAGRTGNAAARHRRELSRFVSRVAGARHRAFDQIEPLAQGRVWLGDRRPGRAAWWTQLGGLDTAIGAAEEEGRDSRRRERQPGDVSVAA